MSTSTPQASANPALSRLAVFVSEWTWQATLEGQPFGNGRAIDLKEVVHQEFRVIKQ